MVGVARTHVKLNREWVTVRATQRTERVQKLSNTGREWPLTVAQVVHNLVSIRVSHQHRACAEGVPCVRVSAFTPTEKLVYGARSINHKDICGIGIEGGGSKLFACLHLEPSLDTSSKVPQQGLYPNVRYILQVMQFKLNHMSLKYRVTTTEHKNIITLVSTPRTMMLMIYM